MSRRNGLVVAGSLALMLAGSVGIGASDLPSRYGLAPAAQSCSRTMLRAARMTGDTDAASRSALRPISARAKGTDLATSDVSLAGTVYFDDTPFSGISDVVPFVWIRDNSTGEGYSDWTGWYDPETAEYRFDNLPEGTITIVMNFHVAAALDTLPGNYRVSTSVYLGELSPAEREDYSLSAHRILGLSAPEDTHEILLYSCGFPTHPVFSSPVHLAWDEVPEASSYRVGLFKELSADHPDGWSAINLDNFELESNELDLDLPVSDRNEGYLVTIGAYGARTGDRVGMLMTTYQGCYGWDYRFRVSSLNPSSPTAPSSLTAKAISDSEVELAWQDNSSDEETFRIEVKERDGSYRQLAPLGSDTTSVVAGNLKPETEYTFRVRSQNEQGISEYSNEATVTTPWGHCTEAETALCLNRDRFKISVSWTDFQGDSGVGHAVPLTSDTGYFWFFNHANIEVVIKVLDGRGINNHFWVLYGALSNVEYTITITDVATGLVKAYFNPSGQFASLGDTSAIPGDEEAGTASLPSAGWRVDRRAFPDSPRGRGGLAVLGTTTADQVSFTWSPSSPVAGSPVTFTDNQPAGDQRYWDFGDETAVVMATSQSTQHTFSASGTYDVSLQVMSAGSIGTSVSSVVESVSVGSGGNPAIVVTGPAEGPVDTSLTFSATAQNCSPNASGWSWSASGGGQFQGSSDSSSVSVAWSSAGTKTVSSSNSACAGASGSAQVVIEAPPATCDYQVSPTDLRFGPDGGSGTVWVTTQSDCDWQASSGVAWITISSGSSGSGSGSVALTVSANSGATRSASLTVAGETVTVTQDAAGETCSYTLSPQSESYTAAGGDGSVSVTADAGCSWQATSSEEWITVVSGSGTGSGEVDYSVDANPGDARAGTIAVGNAALAIHQEGTEPAQPSCVAGPTVLCLGDGRFKVSASWRDFSDRVGPAYAVPLTRDTGYFWFFSDSNVELILKVLDGRSLNGWYWVFYGALSNVEYTIDVTDTVTGAGKTYVNPMESFASVGDTWALPGEE